jgi:hypothetical protein
MFVSMDEGMLRECDDDRGPAAGRDDLAGLVARGLTVAEIAAHTGRAQRTVREWLREAGLAAARPVRPARGPLAPRARFEGRCAVHGPVTFVMRRDGSPACTRCRSESVSRRRRAVKARLVGEHGGACRACGHDRCLAALQFHHLDPATKRFDVGRGMARGRGIDALREELRRCVLLCANCHAEVEHGLREPPGTMPRDISA